MEPCDLLTRRIKLLVQHMTGYPYRSLEEVFLCASSEQLVYLYLMNTVNYTTSHIFLFLLMDRRGVTN